MSDSNNNNTLSEIHAFMQKLSNYSTKNNSAIDNLNARLDKLENSKRKQVDSSKGGPFKKSKTNILQQGQRDLVRNEPAVPLAGNCSDHHNFSGGPSANPDTVNPQLIIEATVDTETGILQLDNEDLDLDSLEQNLKGKKT